MSYTSYGTTSEVDRLRSELSSLRYSLSELEDLPSELESVRDDVRALEQWREETSGQQEQIDDLERGAGELETQISDVDKAQSRLADRITWLENHIRASGGATLAELDAGDAETAKQARAIRAGRAAAARLLTDWQRIPLQSVIEQFDKAVKDTEAAEAAIRTAVEQVASTDRKHPGHAIAAAAMRKARTKLDTAIATARQLKDERRDAIEQLAEDDALRSELSGAIKAGQRAETALATRLRTRLIEAVGDRAMLPVWFATTFGPATPAAGAQAWLDLATQVMLYRAVYQINDPVLILGPTPARDAPQHQRERYNKLITELGRLS